MDLISIIMPTYNVSNYIDEAVNSILNQTYSNFELIIVDDASTDKTYEKLLKLSKKDNRIKVFRNRYNSKICYTLNKALKHVNGEYVARMDGDDVCLPNRLEVLKRYLDSHSQCSLVGSQVISIDENGGFVSKKKYLQSNEFISFFMRYTPCVSHIWLARKCVYDSLQGYRDIPYAEDYDFLLRGLTAGFKFNNVKDYVYKVRIRNGNTATTNGLVQRKTKNYVYKISKLEKNKKQNMFDVNLYKKYISSSRKEEEKYKESAILLNKAIMSKKNKLKLTIYVIRSMSKSKYMMEYVFCSFASRVGIKLEELFFWIKKSEINRI